MARNPGLTALFDQALASVDEEVTHVIAVYRAVEAQEGPERAMGGMHAYLTTTHTPENVADIAIVALRRLSEATS